MSWKVINEIIGLAAVDPDFCQELLTNSSSAIQKKGFQLTAAEFEILCSIKVNNIAEFGQVVLEKFAPYRSSKT